MKPLLPLLSLLLLTACAAPQTRELRAAAPVDAAPVDVQTVPFLAQGGEPSGPAALAMLLQQTGREVTPAELAAQWPASADPDETVVTLANAARQQGRLVYPVAPQLEALLAALEQGYPVLVTQRRRLVSPTEFAVLVGADRRQETFRLHTGQVAGDTLPFATFEKRWARGGQWATLVLDPALLPDTLESSVVVRELAVMAQLGATTDAQAGFARTVINWPEQKSAWLGLASLAQRHGDVPLAESTLRELTRRQPSYGPGLNNLADLLLRTGRTQEALDYAERAVTVLDIPQTRATLAAIHAALREQEERTSR